MLGGLRMTTFASLPELEIVRARFGLGVNVRTGETGAGKSLIDEAVNLPLRECD